MGGNLTDDLIITAIALGQKYVYHDSSHSYDDSDDEDDEDADVSLSFKPTVHGVCPTEYTVNAREDTATDVSLSRDLSDCDGFSAHRQDVSPLAIITGLVRHQAFISTPVRFWGAILVLTGVGRFSHRHVCLYLQNYPLSKMISSTQTCNYNFDNQKKHMTKGTCTEKHIFLPLSSQ